MRCLGCRMSERCRVRENKSVEIKTLNSEASGGFSM